MKRFVVLKRWFEQHKTAGILILLFVILLVFGLWRNVRRGIYVGDFFLYRKDASWYKNASDEIRMSREEDRTFFTINYDGEEKSAELIWNVEEAADSILQDQKYATITFGDGSVVEGKWDNNQFGMLVDEDGLPLEWGEVTVTIAGERPEISDVSWSNALCRMDLGLTEKNGEIWFVVIGAICYILGVLNFLYPEQMYFLFSRWKYARAELSDVGIAVEKIGAVVVMIMGAVFMMRLFHI